MYNFETLLGADPPEMLEVKSLLADRTGSSSYTSSGKPLKRRGRD
jgi:hypothetical protein